MATPIIIGRDIYAVWWIYLMVGSAVAYASALLFGVPIYVVMKRLMKLTWWHTASAGGMCGFPYWLISEYPYSSTYFKYQGLTNLALYVLAGAIAGLVFWLITRDVVSSNSTIERDTRKSRTRPSL